MKFRKVILKAGKYTVPQSNGSVLEVDVTPLRLKHWEGQFSRLSGAGNVVPVIWDHASEDESLPLSINDFQQRRSAKNTVGHLTKFRVTADGESAEILLDLKDKSAVDKAASNTVFVSPVVSPTWTDGNGNEFSDLVTHMDLVNHPVDTKQTAFESIEDDQPVIACGLRFSSGPLLTFAAEAIDSPEQIADESKVITNLKTLIELLRQHDIVIADDTDESTLLERLISALGTSAAINNLKRNPEKEGAQSPHVLMSTETNTDPAIKVEVREVPAQFSAEQQAMIDRATSITQQGLTKRLAEVKESGRCTPKEFKEREPLLNQVQLSVDAGGKEIPSKLEDWIASRESIPAWSCWSKDGKDPAAQKNAAVRMSAEQTIPHPALSDDDYSEEDYDRIADEVLGVRRSG